MTRTACNILVTDRTGSPARIIILDGPNAFTGRRCTAALCILPDVSPLAFEEIVRVAAITAEMVYAGFPNLNGCDN